MSVLILDAGGVLISEPVPRFLREVAEAGGGAAGGGEAEGGAAGDGAAGGGEVAARLREVTRVFEEEISSPLWAGELDTLTAVARLLECAGAPGHPRLWERRLGVMFEPVMEACAAVGAWAAAGQVMVVCSNHRVTWLEEALAAGGVLQHLPVRCVSEETGLVKPEVEVFEWALEIADCGVEDAVLVDARHENLAAAAQIGLGGILAHEQYPGEWIAQVGRWRASTP